MKKIFYILSLVFIACHFDLDKNLGNDLSKKSTLHTDTYVSKPNIAIKNTAFVNIASPKSYLLGVYKSATHGMLKASVIANLRTLSNPEYTNKTPNAGQEIIPVIDEVVLYIPYYYTFIKTTKDNKKKFRLDSIYGNTTQKGLNLNIYPLETILHSTNAEGNAQIYPSNKTYQFDDKKLVGTLKNYLPSPSDTITYIDRRTLDSKKYETSKIKLENSAPRLAIRLNKQFFKEKILDKMTKSNEKEPEIFKTNQNFKRYFKGLYIQAEEGINNTLLSLKLTDAFIDIYYTNNYVTAGTKDILDKKEKKISLNFSTLISNRFEHDHNHLKNDKIYLQGAGGYESAISLLGYDENNPNTISEQLKNLRKKANEPGKKWMITDANLRFYLDDLSYIDRSNMKLKDTIYRLFMYVKYPKENKRLLDEGTTSTKIQGALLKIKDKKEYFYEFKLTDYIAKLLEKDNDKNIGQMILRIYNPTDVYKENTENPVRNQSWNPKKVVLYKGNYQDSSDEKAIRLKINYTREN